MSVGTSVAVQEASCHPVKWHLADVGEGPQGPVTLAGEALVPSPKLALVVQRGSLIFKVYNCVLTCVCMSVCVPQ